MKVYKSLLAAFTEETGKDAAVAAAEVAIKALLGDAAKKGWSKERQDACRSVYAANQAPVYETLAGSLRGVELAETGDGINRYHKVRLLLRTDRGDNIIVSLERDTELTQRLLCKLVNVEPGTPVVLGASTEPVTRNGRTFINHVPTLKVAGREVPAESGHFAAAAEKGKAATEAMRTGLEAAGLGSNPDEMKKMLERARVGAKNTYFAELAERVQAQFATAAMACTA